MGPSITVKYVIKLPFLRFPKCKENQVNPRWGLHNNLKLA